MRHGHHTHVKNCRHVLVGLVFVIIGAWLVLPNLTVAQRSPRRRSVPTTQRTRIDYSKFSHATAKHQQACKTCHSVPTKNWQKTREYPDVVDYPEHAACVSCHRQQFFKGTRPSICSVCHSKISPRDEARFAFRSPQHSRQFAIEFPHDKHQDVIARAPVLRRQKELFWIIPASLKPLADRDKSYNNCEICHSTRSDFSAPAAGWPDGFVPDKVTFKSVPTSHSSCFNCHWRSEEPVSGNCAGCHKLSTSTAAPKPMQRISLKFRHEGGGEKKTHIAECTTCHINITKAASLRGLKPDVPITACTECHNKQGLRLDLSTELESIDKNAKFVCVYCHTSDVGAREAPRSHYLIAERPPMKRSDVK
jgi:hypothetical protein